MFIKGNRTAHDRLERHTERVLNPTIRSQSAMAFAEQQAGRPSSRISTPTAAGPLEAPAGEITLTEVELDHGLLDLATVASDERGPDFKVSEDVSFPTEVQQRTLIADDLRRLVRLFEDGVISEQEFDAAKAKLLR